MGVKCQKCNNELIPDDFFRGMCLKCKTLISGEIEEEYRIQKEKQEGEKQEEFLKAKNDRDKERKEQEELERNKQKEQVSENKSNPAIAYNSVVGAIVGLVFLIGFGWYYFGGGLHKQAAKDMQQIEQQVATDAVKQYIIVKKNGGSAIEAYTYAGMVVAAYAQAKDEVNYRKWKEIEKQEAARAGIPNY